jgi:type IV secretion system protein VirB3
MTPDGFEIAFHGALSEPVMLGGVPRMIAIVIGTLTAILVLGLQTPWIGVPLGLALHAGAYAISRRDPYAFDVLRRHMRQQPYLDA